MKPAVAVPLALIVVGGVLIGLLLTRRGDVGPQPTPPAQLDDAAFANLPPLEALDVTPSGAGAGFSLLEPTATGIDFANALSPESVVANRIRLIGGGVAAGDIDADGDCDLFFCGNDVPNALYRNLGELRFERVEAPELALADRPSTGACFADLDGDGDLDLLVSAIGRNACFLNDGAGSFSPHPLPDAEATWGSTTWALSDVDGDGDLDVYQTNYRAQTRRGSGEVLNLPRDAKGELQIPPELANDLVRTANGEVVELGDPDALWLNDGEAGFQATRFPDRFLAEDGSRASQTRDWSLTAAFRDVDADGDADLYVCNDFWSPDRLWLNDGKGSFRAASGEAWRNSSWFSMALDSADVDRDGDVDLFVTDMLSRQHRRQKTQMGNMRATPAGSETAVRPQFMRNTLQLNRGDGTFAEAAQWAGVQASEWSWGTAFLDVDLDGYEDLLVATGYGYDVQDSDTTERLLAESGETSAEAWRRTILDYPRLDTPNVAFKNLGDGRFTDAGASWGFAQPGVSQGLALADLDGDGDLDVILNQDNAPAAIYRNDSPAPRLAVRLHGAGKNSQGIGARITVRGGPVLQAQEVVCGGMYLSGSEPTRVFACGDAAQLEVNVRWPNGTQSNVSARPNQVLLIREIGAELPPDATPAPSPAPLFSDERTALGHVHEDAEFNDFARQSLLPNRLSTLGPGVAWADVDRDGDLDGLVTGGAGSALTLLRQGKAGFTSEPSVAAEGDQSAVLVDPSSGRVWLGTSGYETSVAQAALAVEGGQQVAAIATGTAATGPMALGDIDCDGDLDLVLGERVRPGRYPEACDVRIFWNTGEAYEPGPVFEDVGLVSGLCLSDLAGNGRPELLIALEWGPLMVLQRFGEEWVDQTAAWGFDLPGWWQGVTTADLDGDGRLEVLATNWGLNSKYHASREHPARIYYRDFDENGTLDVVEAKLGKDGKELPVRGLSCSSRAMPFVRERTPSFSEFGSATLDTIYGDALGDSGRVEAWHLAHTVFRYGEGGRYVATPFPDEAQLAPAFGVSVLDANLDGKDDVFLAQSFFGTQVETPRHDAGRGLLLLGDGAGGLRPLPAAESGIRIYGEGRGCAVGDYDRDGRPDLLVGQHRGATVLLHNQHPDAGVRVRLEQHSADEAVSGGALRVICGDWGGPLREVKLGAGYASQDDTVQVCGTGGRTPTEVWVRWSGGVEQTLPWPPGATSVVVTRQGVESE